MDDTKTRPFPPSREELEGLYVAEGMSCKRIAPIYGVAPKTVHYWLKRYELPIRSRLEARRVAVPPTYSEEALERKRQIVAENRKKITAEGLKRGGEKRRGRKPPNKGKPMSEAQRQILIEQRADPEYRKRMQDRHTGEKNANWKGGSKSLHERQLDTAEWARTRRLVYARDAYTCQDCRRPTLNFRDSRNDPSRRVQAHHIIPRRYGGGDELENLVTLCARCHTKRERAADGKLFA